jgi:phage head maturation protease
MSYVQDSYDLAIMLRRLLDTQAIQQHVNDEALRAGQADPEMLALVAEAEGLYKKLNPTNDAASYKIIVEVRDGLVQNVSFEFWPYTVVHIHDYDIDDLGAFDKVDRKCGYTLEIYTP